MKNEKTLFLTQGAMIAALYVVLTLVSNLFGLASGTVQIRLSEALTVLPFFTPAAIPGLFLGCMLANTLTGACLLDILGGSMITLFAALITYGLRKYKWLAPAAPILGNAIFVPLILYYGYGIHNIPYWISFLTVGAGEVLSCGVLGILLLFALQKSPAVRLFSAANK